MERDPYLARIRERVNDFLNNSEGTAASFYNLTDALALDDPSIVAKVLERSNIFALQAPTDPVSGAGRDARGRPRSRRGGEPFFIVSTVYQLLK